ncbi:MAG: DUF222 domain-containing protein [Acidimicrobiia bacterium]
MAIAEVATTAPGHDPSVETLERAARMPLERLEDEVSRTAADLAAATCRWLVLVGELDRRQGWAGWGVASCAHWLSWRCGIDIRTAREHVRVGRALPELPVTRGAFARGELSYSKARELTRVATADTEAPLVEAALQMTASQLAHLLGAHRRVSREDAGEIHAGREFLVGADAEGHTELRIRLAPEEAQQLIARLDDIVDEEGLLDDGPAGPSRCVHTTPRSQGRVDALVLLAGGTEPSVSSEIVVHVDAHTLTGDDPDGDTVDLHRRCHLDDDTPVPVDTARRLACDSTVVEVATDHHRTPLSVGRRSRKIPNRIRRALQIRDGRCRFPGCDNRRYVDAHHIVHWANGGDTSLDNLVVLCRRHHRSVHEDGFTLRLVDGHHIEVTRPDGIPIHNTGPAEPSDPHRPIHHNRQNSITPGPRTATARDGTRMDLDLTAAGYFPILDQATASRLE